jgi:hypothetical protein
MLVAGGSGMAPAPGMARPSLYIEANTTTSAEGDPTVSETTSDWRDTSLSPRERAEKLVEAMTLEQKIAQLHGAMETIATSSTSPKIRSCLG